MTVHGIERSESLSSQANTSRIHDTESKGIENQITSARQQLQKLSSDQEMTVEEKKQKRQEVQKQIADLNRELRQHQMELRKEQLEEQQDRKADAKEANNENRADKAGTPESEKEKREDNKEDQEQQVSFPKGSMTAIVSAETSKGQADTQRSVVLSLEGTARIMQSEIDLDAGRGQNTERKRAALESIQQRASRASQAQFGLLSNATRNIQKIGPQDRQVFHKQQESQNDARIAAMVGAPQKESAQHALQSYYAGKRYSTVTFHV